LVRTLLIPSFHLFDVVQKKREDSMNVCKECGKPNDEEQAQLKYESFLRAFALSQRAFADFDCGEWSDGIEREWPFCSCCDDERSSSMPEEDEEEA
jgi:hypothetical protein